MSRRGFVAGTTALLAAAALGRFPQSAFGAAEAGQLFYYNWGGVREPQDLPGVHEGDGDPGQEGLLHLERGAVREAQGWRPRLRPRGADRLHGADPRRREAPPADRLVEAPDRGQDDRPEVPQAPVRPQGHLLGGEGLGHDRVHVPLRPRQGAARRPGVSSSTSRRRSTRARSPCSTASPSASARCS